MVAMPSDMREAAFLQLKATYVKLRAAYMRVQQEWSGKIDPSESLGPWLQTYNQAQSHFRDAQMDFDAAAKLFSREIGPCPTSQEMRHYFQTGR
jgi:hypothetical protein